MYYPVPWNNLHVLTYELSQKIRTAEKHFDCIVTVARGGLAIANILADHLRIPVADFTVSTYKGMEKLAKPEIKFSVPPEVKGMKVLLLDDIADTGETLEFGKEYLTHHGVTEVTTAALFYKKTSSHLPDFYVEHVSAWVIFPFEIEETMGVYKSLLGKDKDKADELYQNILRLDLPEDLITSIKHKLAIT